MKRNLKDFINTQISDILEITEQKKITELDKDRIRAKVIGIRQAVKQYTALLKEFLRLWESPEAIGPEMERFYEKAKQHIKEKLLDDCSLEDVEISTALYGSKEQK